MKNFSITVFLGLATILFLFPFDYGQSQQDSVSGENNYCKNVSKPINPGGIFGGFVENLGEAVNNAGEALCKLSIVEYPDGSTCDPNITSCPPVTPQSESTCDPNITSCPPVTSQTDTQNGVDTDGDGIIDSGDTSQTDTQNNERISSKVPKQELSGATESDLQHIVLDFAEVAFFREINIADQCSCLVLGSLSVSAGLVGIGGSLQSSFYFDGNNPDGVDIGMAYGTEGITQLLPSASLTSGYTIFPNHGREILHENLVPLRISGNVGPLVGEGTVFLDPSSGEIVGYSAFGGSGLSGGLYLDKLSNPKKTMDRLDQIPEIGTGVPISSDNVWIGRSTR